MFLLRRSERRFEKLARPVPVVASECRRSAKGKQIRLGLAGILHGLRPANDRKSPAIGRIKAALLLQPLPPRGIFRIARFKGDIVERFKILLQLADDGHLIAILQVPPNARQMNAARLIVLITEDLPAAVAQGAELSFFCDYTLCRFECVEKGAVFPDCA